MKTRKHLIVALACVLSITTASCVEGSSVPPATAIDAGKAICEVIIAATDPKLAPLCTTAAAVADAVAAIVAQRTNVGAGVRGFVVHYEPTGDEVYGYLADHGAKPAGR